MREGVREREREGEGERERERESYWGGVTSALILQMLFVLNDLM